MKNMSPKFYAMLDLVNRAEHLDLDELETLEHDLTKYIEGSPDCRRDRYQKRRAERMRERVRDEMLIITHKVP